MADEITTQSLMDLLDTIGRSNNSTPSYRDLTNKGLNTSEALRQYSVNQGTAGTYDRNSIPNTNQPPIGTVLKQDPRAIQTQQIPTEVLALQKSPQTMQDAIGSQQAVKTPDNKLDWVKSISAALAGLGGLGGTAANIIGAVKRSGSPGDAAIESSQSLLKLLGEADKNAQKQASEDAKRKMAMQYISGLDLDQRTKDTSLALINAGYVDDGLKNADRVYQEREIGKARVEGEIEKLTNPKLNAAKLKVKEDKQAIDAQMPLKEIEALTNKYGDLQQKIDEGKSLSASETLQHQALQNKFKKEVAPGTIASINRAADKQAAEYNKFADYYENLKDLKGVLNKIPDGRWSGTIADMAQKVSPDEDVTKYKTLMALLEVPTAKTVMGEVGNLAENERKAALEALKAINLSKAERAARLAIVEKALDRIVNVQFNRIDSFGKGILDYKLSDQYRADGMIPSRCT